MHRNHFTATLRSGSNKWLGKRCRLPFIAAFFVGSHCAPSYTVFSAWVWDWVPGPESECCHLGGMLRQWDAGETGRWSGPWDGSEAGEPQRVSLWWAVTGRWSDRSAEENEEGMRGCQEDGCGCAAVAVGVKCVLMSGVFLYRRRPQIHKHVIIIPLDHETFIWFFFHGFTTKLLSSPNTIQGSWTALCLGSCSQYFAEIWLFYIVI